MYGGVEVLIINNVIIFGMYSTCKLFFSLGRTVFHGQALENSLSRVREKLSGLGSLYCDIQKLLHVSY